MSLTELRANVAFPCPTCKALSYFERENQWPSELTARTPSGRFTIHHGAQEDYLSKLTHVAVWRCVGCSEFVVLVYPKGLIAPATRIWPLGSVRSLAEASLPSGVVPEAISKDFKEASLIEELSPAASASLSRRCLQAIILDKYADVVGVAQRLKQQVKAVILARRLPDYIAEELNGIRSIGNNAAHSSVDPATNEVIEVEAGEAAACLDVLQELVQFVYIEPYRAAQRKIAREQKHGRDDR